MLKMLEEGERRSSNERSRERMNREMLGHFRMGEKMPAVGSEAREEV